MIYGVCCGLGMAPAVADTGYDYVELTVGTALVPFDTDEAFARMLETLRQLPLPCRAVNVFAPASLRLTGPDIDPAAQEKYGMCVCARARAAGIPTIVLGAGGARHVPAGFDRAEALRQFAAFSALLAQIALDHGVTIGLEALSPTECNFITSVADAAGVVRAAEHPGLRLTVDGYHWACAHDSAEALLTAGPLIVHTHIATWPNRLAPGGEDCPLSLFTTALKEAGYDGSMSVEAAIKDPHVDLPHALSVLRGLMAR